MLKITGDQKRFQQILRGRIKKDLRKYITQSELFGKKGKDIVSIPVPQIDLPRFMHDPYQRGGVGQGEGEIGDVIAREPGEGTGQAGDEEGQHVLEAELTIDELADMIGEDMGLPNIQPKGKDELENAKNVYTGISSSGPDSLIHRRRTFKRSLLRHIASGTYDRKNPIITPVRQDYRHRCIKKKPMPEANAAIIYLMDVSGSMGAAQKWLVRTESFWIDAWLQRQYPNVKKKYVIHDFAAKEVDEHYFYRTREAGGTSISAGLREVQRVINMYFPPEEWNIYVFQFSDGDNLFVEDSNTCMRIMEEELLPIVNLYCYGQCWSEHGSGDYLDELKLWFDLEEEDEDGLFMSDAEGKLRTHMIYDEDQIYDGIQHFLRTGR